MEWWHWFTETIGAIGVICSLLFTGITMHSEGRTRKIANLLALTASHREIWKEFFRRPELRRVLAPSADLNREPLTTEEKEFVNFVILHLSSTYYALKDEILIKLDGLRRDAGSFLTLPVPSAVWEQTRIFQNDDFVTFVEECRKGAQRESQKEAVSVSE